MIIYNIVLIIEYTAVCVFQSIRNNYRGNYYYIVTLVIREMVKCMEKEIYGILWLIFSLLLTNMYCSSATGINIIAKCILFKKKINWPKSFYNQMCLLEQTTAKHELQKKHHIMCICRWTASDRHSLIHHIYTRGALHSWPQIGDKTQLIT